MAIMRRHSRLAASLVLCLAADSLAAAGFASRDMNPMLQPIYLPRLVPMTAEAGWRIDHSLYITNTLQNLSRGDEELVLDVENYRYEFALRNRRGNWLTQITVPLLANEGGQLDSLIEDWHDLFGLPQGKRDRFPRDQLEIVYRRDGETVYSQTESSSGLGDISLALGYQKPGATGYFVGVDLPTGSEDDFTGNEALDFGFWLTREIPLDEKFTGFGLLGISFPGDGGSLEGLVADQIWVAQLGADYRFRDDIIGTLQLDFHSASIEDSELKAFGESLQVLVGLGFANLFGEHRLDLFFTEDIYVGSAPDITFGLRLAREF